MVVVRVGGVGASSLLRREREWVGKRRLRSTAIQTNGTKRKVVVLTREAGKNVGLAAALRGAIGEGRTDRVVEVPVLESVEREGGKNRFLKLLRDGENANAWVVVTSPEGGRIAMQTWLDAGKPKVRIAAVGEATAKSIEVYSNGELSVSFQPSRSLGSVLAAELPTTSGRFGRGGKTRVLYPSSERAGGDVQGGLEKRGFVVERIDTYTVQAVSRIDEEVKKELADSIAFLTFASPSAVEAWVGLFPDSPDTAAGAVCIGETSAYAACQKGFKRVWYPDKPGSVTWARCVRDALTC